LRYEGMFRRGNYNLNSKHSALLQDTDAFVNLRTGQGNKHSLGWTLDHFA